MKIETFELERIQSVWENVVKYNLTESGVHPLSLNDILSENEIKALLATHLGYSQTNGSVELRQAIRSLYPGATMDNILVTNGSAEANYTALWTMLEAGDELIYMLPNYMQLWGLAHSFGMSVKTFSLREDSNWAPDLDELNKLITDRTEMIAVCNPNNPTGAVLSESEMNEIIRLAEKHDAWIFSDEVYRGAELQGQETDSFWGKYKKVIVNGGLSKAYALPGLRIGWLVAPPDVIETCWAHHDYISIAATKISNFVAAKVLQPGLRQKILSRNRNILRENLHFLEDWLRNRSHLFQWVSPQAGGIIFIKYNFDINSSELSRKLREEKDVFILPGDSFGMDRYFRLGIGGEKSHFTTGLNLIDEALTEIISG